MKICFICSEYPPGPHGGIGTMVQLFARELARRGHQVRVVGVYPKSYPAPDSENDQGVQVFRLRAPSMRFSWIGMRWKLFHQICDWALSGEIDLIEVPDYGGWCAFWGDLPIPVIMRCNGSSTYFAAILNRELDRITALLDYSSFYRADYRIAVSAYTAKIFNKIYELDKRYIHVIYNPAEIIMKKSTIVRDPLKVVFFGTMTEKKGIISLVIAWAKVRIESPEAELHVFGKDTILPSGEKMSEMLMRQYGATESNNVFMHGAVDRSQLISEVLPQAGVVILPSFAEAFSLAALEAMTCECPTIYSRSTSGEELIDDGRDGLLISPESPDEIAEAIIKLLNDKELAARLGLAGRLKAESQFSVSKILDQVEQHYSDCVQQFGLGKSKSRKRITPNSFQRFYKSIQNDKVTK